MILVTGASGMVGRALVTELTASGTPFRAGFSTEAKAAAARGGGLNAVVCDFTRPATIAEALSGCDRLFLLSGGLREQTAAEVAAVRAAARARVEHIVKLSVWGAAEEQFSFARIHRPVEREIEASGVGWTHLRPNGFLQILLTATPLLEQGTLCQPGGSAAISHIDVRDVAAVAAACLTRAGHAGRAYALSGPEALTWSEIAARMTATLGRPVRYVDVPDEQARQGMLAAGLPAWHVEWVLDSSRYSRAGHAARVTHDVRQVLGRAPITLERFLLDHAAALGRRIRTETTGTGS